MVAVPASMIARRWPASSTSCAPGCPGGCCRPGTGLRQPVTCWRRLRDWHGPASGNGCTTRCWTSSAAKASSTGRGRAWTRRACAPTGGALTGPNPTDRGKPGSKYHLLVDRRASRQPSACQPPTPTTHCYWSRWSTPSRRSRARVADPGRPRRGPPSSTWTRATTTPRCRRALRRRGIRPRIARRGVESSTRLGRHRYVVERSLAWLLGYRRLARSATSGAPTSSSASSTSPAH